MSLHRLARSAAITLVFAALATPATAAASSGADQAERALHLRSQALNDRYVLAGTTDPAEAALVRDEASNGIDWADAGIGAGGMLLVLSVVSLGTYTVVHRRADPGRRGTTTAA
jgi:hypothetical protein